jgi:hypothetical protein
MSVLDARMLRPPRLSFDPAIPSRTDTQAYQGLKRYGPFDASRVNLQERSILIVFPESLKPLAANLIRALQDGHRGFPGFGQMFRLPFARDNVAPLTITGNFSTPTAAARSYREAIADWNSKSSYGDPELALVLVPHSERWETERPYYEAKASFAQLGIPTQMVTAELLQNEREFGWSVANIALAMFAKLGGVPWIVESPAGDKDLIIGIGRADIRNQGDLRRIFGYALSFTSNGAYQQSWSFTPAADEQTYLARLEEAIVNAFNSSRDTDEPVQRLVIHLGKRTGWKEAAAARRAMTAADISLPVALMRLDDSSLHDIADGLEDTLAPPKGLAVRLGTRQVLLQTEGLTATGVPTGPLLIELDERSQVGQEALDDLVSQAFRLAHANWRGFNARSQPVTLLYGELLARLVGYLEEVETWNPTLLRTELRDRPWFL